MPRFGITRSLASAVTIATLAACASGGSETNAADTATGAVATVDTPAATQSCVVRGSLEEARNRPSPLGELTFTLGGEEALLCYGRPAAKGRTVMGQLVPYGSPWRLGANEATAIHLPFAAQIGDVAVEPGVYSLYAVPGETEWRIHVNRQAERWGIPVNDAVMADDVGSFTRPATRTDASVEQLEFTWEPQGDSAGNLVMQWENTRVEIPVSRAGS